MSTPRPYSKTIATLRACNRFDYKKSARRIIRILEGVSTALLRRPMLGGPLLWSSVLYESVELIEWLLARGVNVNVIDPMYSYQAKRAIEAAASRGHADVVRLLIERGSDINWASEAQPLASPPLQKAVLNNHLPVVRLLVEAGALLNAIDNNRRTPLDVSMMFGYTEIAEYLRSQGGISNIPARSQHRVT